MEKFGSGIHPQHFFLLLLSLVRLLYRWNCFCFGCRRRRWASWLVGARSQTRRRRRERPRICSPPPRSFPVASSQSSTTSSSNWSAAKWAARQLIGRRQNGPLDSWLVGDHYAEWQIVSWLDAIPPTPFGSSCYLPDMSCLLHTITRILILWLVPWVDGHRTVEYIYVVRTVPTFMHIAAAHV